MNHKINLINKFSYFFSYVIYKVIILLLFFLCIQFNYAQKTQSFHIPDSLKNKSYKELHKAQKLFFNDTARAKIYAKAYLHKAKNEGDTIKIAGAYSQLASITTNANLALEYSDSIISLTKNMKHFIYPGFGYMIKGVCKFQLGYYEKALDYYLIAQQYATNNNNTEQTLNIKNVIGKLKNFWGNYDEALKDFKFILQQLNQQNNVEFRYKDFLYLSTLYGISNSYVFAKKYDSALIYVKKGIQKSLALKDSIYYYNFVSQSGIVAYYQNNFKIAIDSLDKALPYETSNNSFLNDHYYRGNIYCKQKNKVKAFYHFKKADSIYNLTNDVVPEVRDIQMYFVNYYKKNNDVENQLKYINRLLLVDSILNKNYKNLNNTLVKKYDTPILIAKKQAIIDNLKNKRKLSSVAIFGLSVLIIVSLGFLISFNRKKRIFKKRFEKLLLNEKKETHIKITNLNKNSSNELIGISIDIIKNILSDLKKFEINNGFLNPEITLNSLSKELHSNSNYLSKIINFYKKKNFSSYISDLRIEYCIKQLKKDKTCRKYSIKAIASEIGFNNAESFSKAFFKKTGLYPSYFIKELEKQTEN